MHRTPGPTESDDFWNVSGDQQVPVASGQSARRPRNPEDLPDRNTPSKTRGFFSRTIHRLSTRGKNSDKIAPAKYKNRDVPIETHNDYTPHRPRLYKRGFGGSVSKYVYQIQRSRLFAVSYGVRVSMFMRCRRAGTSAIEGSIIGDMLTESDAKKSSLVGSNSSGSVSMGNRWRQPITNNRPSSGTSSIIQLRPTRPPLWLYGCMLLRRRPGPKGLYWYQAISVGLVLVY
ncbi:hypothetical protein EDC04DRAFT_2616557 [Pisolithus marmoratus]|nr:hypothetical protein EDC04DRAFT_2616557 [Pisolithus marmoratus]